MDLKVGKLDMKETIKTLDLKKLGKDMIMEKLDELPDVAFPEMDEEELKIFESIGFPGKVVTDKQLELIAANLQIP